MRTAVKQKMLDMIHSTRFRLIVSLLLISILIGLLSLIVGGNMLYKSVITEANHRVSQDLNVARMVYDERIQSICRALEIVSDFPEFQQALVSGDRDYLLNQIEKLSDHLGLDFAGILDQNRRVNNRLGAQYAETVPANKVLPLADLALNQGKTVWGTIVLDRETIQDENPQLLQKAIIPTKKTASTKAELESQIFSGLAIGAAVPVKLNGQLIGTIYGAVLLNQDESIVDKIGETVFRNETYKGRHVGTSTIFFESLRIATNVMDQDGHRALGTFASEDVSRHVLVEGKRWTDRAQVLSDWYITAYEPITDIFGQRVGMLYVGALEAKYLDVRKRAIIVFALITMAGVMSSLVLGWFLTGIIISPINRLIRASVEISKGNYSPDINPISKCDIGLLQREFLKMTSALKEREKRQKEESEIFLIQSEKQASVGKLAAGVAHEINNPLTAVLTFTHLILRRDDLAEEVRTDLETIASQTERVRKIVKSLLDFSRQSELHPEQLNLNSEIEKSINLLENQALIKGVKLTFDPGSGLPSFMLDRNLCQSVWINMIINALDATEPGDTIEVRTRHAQSEEKRGAEIIIQDTGSGIRPENMDQLFDPFFTTKEVGKGTGLGLAVSAGIVERHEGTIKAASTLGEGTSFTIWLPAMSQDSSPLPNHTVEVSHESPDC